MLRLILLCSADDIPVVAGPFSVESLQEGVHVLILHEGLKLAVHSHFRGIIVILIVCHVAGFNVLAHSVQLGRQFKISLLAGNGVLVGDILLNHIILKQEIRFNLPASTLFSYTELTPSSKNGETLTYGPFTSVSPFVSPVSVRLHFPSVAKFRTLETVEREIEISHWGNVAIEEVIRARNSGSPLTGEFSRLDYYKSDPDSVPFWGESQAKGVKCRGTDREDR